MQSLFHQRPGRRAVQISALILLVFVNLLACQAVSRSLNGLVQGGRESTRTSPAHIPVTPSSFPQTAEPERTEAPTKSAAPDTAVPGLAETEPPSILPAPRQAFTTTLHPDGDLFVGDRISIEILAPQGTNGKDTQIEVRFQSEDGEQSATGKFERYGIGGRPQATFYWVWDTAGLEAGVHPITYTIQPEGFQWTQAVTLLPEEDLPSEEQGAVWASTTSDCCTLHYITGTAAQRDLEDLAGLADTLSEEVSNKLAGEFKEPVSIVLLPRLLGHGGFAAKDISLSYLDRNYAGSSPEIVLNHELVHALDGQLGGELRPALLLEGLAVYLSGGHFKPEPLMPRAAALLELGGYLPLSGLADNFYPSQHETGYLEAGALIEYMVERWGWQQFSAFYRDIHPAPEDGNQEERWSQSEAIDAALQEHFQITLADLDESFQQALRKEQVTEALRQDVQLSIRQYDSVRRYQKLLDPSAYFMTAWLPDGRVMREKGIVADYLRHPEDLENLVIEVMLLSTDASLRSGGYSTAARHLDAINAALTAVESGAADPLLADPLTAEYRAAVDALLANGYEPQRITLNGNTAVALAVPIQGGNGSGGGGLYLQELELVRDFEGWKIPQKIN